MDSLFSLYYLLSPTHIACNEREGNVGLTASFVHVG